MLVVLLWGVGGTFGATLETGTVTIADGKTLSGAGTIIGNLHFAATTACDHTRTLTAILDSCTLAP